MNVSNQVLAEINACCPQLLCSGPPPIGCRRICSPSARKSDPNSLAASVAAGIGGRRRQRIVAGYSAAATDTAQPKRIPRRRTCSGRKLDAVTRSFPPSVPAFLHSSRAALNSRRPANGPAHPARQAQSSTNTPVSAPVSVSAIQH